ncbi:trypsin-like peptidase domain-containing protein [Marinisporobacter balticus]|uniref:Trypsin-like peptidase n=1 Tax=Marinisporobacter balticus TaxID=2018667 RepID=A0A4R2K9D0_9FIRM|nr:trypsin-like peptidase domain-containing protein [Marinisporobacter balticus]TCO68732.1 trypsin-like peptidase [Marinisporobacter balticus]
MIVKTKYLKTMLLQTQNLFEEIKCIFNYERKDSGSLRKSILFCRYIGIDDNVQDYMNRLKELDKYLQTIEVNYIRFTKGLEKVFDMDEIEKMKDIMDHYSALEEQGSISRYALFNLNMGYEIKNECLEWTKKLAFKEILDLYDTNNRNKSKTIRKNFGVKLLFWMNKYLKELFENACDINIIHKIVFYGEIKKHELYFLIFLSKLGCDIIYINPKEDIEDAIPEVKGYSNIIRCRKMHSEIVQWLGETSKQEIKNIPKVQATIRKERVHERPEIKINTYRPDAKRRVEKSYEEIAKLAESVVMIQAYDKNKQLIGKGSGVVISEDGFIITNFHVVGKGVFFGVVFENDPNEYMVYNVVKYHQDYDLALIKVDKPTKPIQLNDKDLVRGQQVVAIGSPLGLFNTISEGIVSGFREFDHIKMVQITAPISPGSSGGALIDRYGNLVGITTAGLEGQNLNMAVPAQYVKQFIGNILNRP